VFTFSRCVGYSLFQLNFQQWTYFRTIDIVGKSHIVKGEKCFWPASRLMTQPKWSVDLNANSVEKCQQLCRQFPWKIFVACAPIIKREGCFV